MRDVLLSVLVPLYNEEEFVRTVLDRILAAPLPDTGHRCSREVIVVDDGSTDGSPETVMEYMAENPEAPVRLVRHESNRGKGAAIRSAVALATGEYSIIQDADLEYDPREYGQLLAPLLEGDADVVFGSRFAMAGGRRVLYYWHSIANWILTTLCNIASDLNLTDMETCYKMFRTSLLQSIPLRSERFGIEPELTIKVAKRQARVFEVPISYRGRTYEEGKKIGMGDAFAAVWSILRFWASPDVYIENGPDILDALAEANRFNRWMADTITPYIGKDVLELGAGMGNLTRHLSRRRRSYVATDIDREHLARLAIRLQHRPNVRTAVCDLTCAGDFANFEQQMDTVVCLNVLEHIDDDLAGLRHIYSTLRQGGRAIVLVPQGAGVYGTLDQVLGHFRRYTHDELASKMKATGFRVESVLEFNRVTYPGWYLNGRILKRRNFGRFQLSVFDRLVPLWRRIDRFLPWSPTSIIGVGVRES